MVNNGNITGNEAPIGHVRHFGNESRRCASRLVHTKLSLPRRVAIGIGLGLAQSICFPPVGWAFLLPMCLAGFLILLDGPDVKQAFRLGFVYALAWYLGDLFWLSNIFGLAALSLCAIMAFFVGLFAGLYVWMARRLPRLPLWLLAALLWTGIEVYRSELFVLSFGWLGLGYGVVNAPVLAAAASWLGCYGLTFTIVVLGALVADEFLRGRWASPCSIGLCALWLLVYFMPLPAAVPSRPLRVRLVQAASEDDQSLFAASHLPKDLGIGAIVWPEYSFVSDPKRQPQLWAKLAGVAIENHCSFLFGAKDEFDPDDPAAYRNTAYLLDPNGRLIGTHVKNHTVHFFRDGVPGKTARAIPTALGRIGVAICFDMDYPDVARRLAEDGAEVFLVPNDDPQEWGPIQHIQHRLMFQMRAAECGRWLARADVAGGTSVASPAGRETVHIRGSGPGFLDVTVGRQNGKTLFVRGGWLFGRCCLAASIGLGLWLVLRGTQASANAVGSRSHRRMEQEESVMRILTVFLALAAVLFSLVAQPLSPRYRRAERWQEGLVGISRPSSMAAIRKQ